MYLNDTNVTSLSNPRMSNTKMALSKRDRFPIYALEKAITLLSHLEEGLQEEIKTIDVHHSNPYFSRQFLFLVREYRKVRQEEGTLEPAYVYLYNDVLREYTVCDYPHQIHGDKLLARLLLNTTREKEKHKQSLLLFLKPKTNAII